MEPVVIARGDVPRAEPRDGFRDTAHRAGHRIFGLLMMAGTMSTAGLALAQEAPPSGPEGARSRLAASRDVGGPPRPTAGPSRPSTPAAGSSGLGGSPTTARKSVAESTVSPRSSASQEIGRFRIRDDAGQCVVARLHGECGGKVALMQPDGQIGFPSKLVPTKDPFAPMTAVELQRRLEKGPYAGFGVISTPHYLVFYQSRLAFAQDSAKLLEDLYRGLIDFCGRHDVPVHESEFPLVAVIFATERDFRAHQPVAPEVQAYYQIFTNRIFFYEESERDRAEPKLVALRKPQTVAHEGTHQILSNIGVQPRLSSWPLWLIEGFAEYCATPMRTKKGLAFDRMGTINALHMATLRELDDPLSSVPIDDEAHARSARPSRLLDSEALITKAQLTPTDYAQAWALTYYLTHRRVDEFKAYLRSMGRMPPLEPRGPEEHLAEFRKFFGDEPAKLDKKVEDFMRKLSQKGNFPALPYYAVTFEQPLGGGMVSRKAWISQSPQMIQRWVEKTVSPRGGMYNWEARPFPTKARAEMAVETWIRGY